MQWPPRPGPGQKGMKPKGLVDAAAMVSQMSMPMRSARMASSLTSAMFTARKVFSRILDSSALSGAGDDVDRLAHEAVQLRGAAGALAGHAADDLGRVARCPSARCRGRPARG